MPVRYVRNPWLHVVSETGTYECPSICTDDCNAVCHEWHSSPRTHDPFVCQSIQLNAANALDALKPPKRHAGRSTQNSA